MDRDTVGEAAPASRSRRLDSVDAMRGLSVAGMILVNDPGSWSHVYPPLRHAEWHGLTPTDLVFPTFLFLVGVSIPLALGRRVEAAGGERRGLVPKILRRTALIFGIGLLLNAIPFDEPLATLRIPGVLQRIAVCYAAAALLYLATTPRQLVAVAVALLAGYWLLMTRVPVPGFGTGDLSRPGNLAAWIDRGVLAGHTYKPDYDPEGLLSTLPAIGTALLGVFAGRWLRSGRDPAEIDAGLFAWGTVAALLGYLWGLVFPINKALWTGSFVLATAGLALLGLGLCFWLIELRGYRRWAWPLLAFGRNAIVAYVLAALLARVLPMIEVAGPDGASVDAKSFLYGRLVDLGLAPMDASLAFAVGFVLACFVPVALMHWRGIVVRV